MHADPIVIVSVARTPIGGFLGAYLGGLAITRFGDFGWMWYADIVLALLAAIANLPIREAPVVRTLAPA
jgi:hypothetical protein